MSDALRCLVAALAAMTLLLHPHVSPAAPAETPSVAKPNTPTSPEAARQFLDDALSSERTALAEVEQNLKRWETLRKQVTDEIENDRAQNAIHSNLLLVPQTQVEELESALNSNRQLVKNLDDRIVEFEKIGGIATGRMDQLKSRIAIAKRQLDDLRKESLPGSDKADLRDRLDNLFVLLNDREKQGERFLSDYHSLFEQLNHLMDNLKETRRQLKERLQLQLRTNLYERDLRPFEQISAQALAAELMTVWYGTADLLREDYWRRQWNFFQQSGAITQTLFVALFALVFFSRRTLRRPIRTVEERLTPTSWRMGRLALFMFRRSFELICAAALLWLYDLLKLPYMNFILGRFLSQMIFTLLLTRWGIDYVRTGLDAFDASVDPLVRKRLIRFFQLLRVVILAYLLLILLFGSASLTVWLVRLLLEAALVGWVIKFWHDLPPAAAATPNGDDSRVAGTRRMVIRVWSYLVAGGAILMELYGYDALAVHWLISWVQTLMLAAWAHIGWLAIQEWRTAQQSASEAQDGGAPPTTAAPVGWFIVQMARLLWLTAGLAGVLLVWSNTEKMMNTLEKVFNFTFSLGSLRFSLAGVVLGGIVLCVTHMATRLARRFLRENILDSRNFDRGLKDSIITITSYLIWGIGLLLALGMLGVNTTSLAVVFGALSIGIGFGLQNIFNNFISGLILLFERPIQVGDYVEINNLWAEVKQINVRSTIVQTFDNATVIIPNSDFISQQVTNWSFKDPRMRRSVDVGVAYGSDIEKVRTILLDIAVHMPEILTYPKPDVLFLDHADSALIFRLRYWTHVDNFYTTSTAVRFELDRRFREENIEIAFPQRDLHIRSVCPDYLSNGTRPSAAASEPQEPTAPPVQTPSRPENDTGSGE